MNQILNRMFNKNLSNMKKLSDRIDTENDVENTIRKYNFKKELDNLGRNLKDVKFGKEVFNSMMTASASITLNPENKDVIEGSLSRLSEEFNDKFNMELNDNELNDVVEESTKFTSIMSNMIVPNHIGINNVKNITNEYSFKTKNNYKKMNAEEVAKTLNNVSHLSSEINKVNSFVSTVTCMNMMMVKLAEKHEVGKKYGLTDIFTNLAANIMAVLKDAYKWDVKDGDDLVTSIYGLIQRIFYAAVIITTILGLIMLVSTAMSAVFSTILPALPFVKYISHIFEFIYDFVGVILTPLAIRTGAAVFSTSVIRTIKKLSGLDILNIINGMIMGLVDLGKKIFGNVYKYIDGFLSKLESTIDDDKPDDTEEDDTDDESEEEDILTQIGGLANSLNNASSYNESKKYITRSIAHTYYKSMI